MDDKLVQTYLEQIRKLNEEANELMARGMKHKADAARGRELVRGWEAAVGDESASFRFGRALIAWAEENPDQ